MGRIGDFFSKAMHGTQPDASAKTEQTGELSNRRVSTSAEPADAKAKSATIRADHEGQAGGLSLRDRAKAKAVEVKDRAMNTIDHRLDRRVVDKKIALIGADNGLDKKSAKDYQLKERLETLKEILGDDSKATADQKVRACAALEAFVEGMPYDHKQADDVQGALGEISVLFYQTDRNLEKSDPEAYNALFRLHESVSIYLPSRWD